MLSYFATIPTNNNITTIAAAPFDCRKDKKSTNMAKSTSLAMIRSVLLPLLLLSNCDAFTSITNIKNAAARTTQLADSSRDDMPEQSRRSAITQVVTSSIGALVGGSLLLPSAALAEAETMERGGVPLTPFNSLAFNYRGGDSPTVDGSTLDEPSISYAEFLEKLNSNQVTFVEFLAPNGDKAYATFKSDESNESKPIRIGEGYPIEDPEGWSSPAFVIKAVAKAKVPYKFVVPGLSASFH